jgi:hypothetical protein
VIVHNAAVPNSVYFRKVDPELSKNIGANDRLFPTRAYLDDRFARFERNCILIASELWKKVEPLDVTRAAVLIRTAHSQMSAGRWNVAEALALFLSMDKPMPETERLTAQLDYWFCKRKQGFWTEIEAEATATDFSSRALRFQLGHAAVVGDRDTFFETLPRALSSSSVSINDLQDWPILSEMADDPRWPVASDSSATRSGT